MLVVLQLDRLLLLLSSVVARHEHAESGGRSSAPEARVVRRRRRRRGLGEARTARGRQRRGRTLQSPPLLLLLLLHLVLRLLSRVVEGDGRRTRRAAQSHVREERRHARAAVGREGRTRRAAARVALDRVGPGTAADAGAHGRVGPAVPGGVALGEGLLLRALHLQGQVGAVPEEPVVAVGARVGSLGDAAEAVEVELALEGRDLVFERGGWRGRARGNGRPIRWMREREVEKMKRR